MYARAVRRLSQSLDCCPDRLTQKTIGDAFRCLVASRS